MGVSTSEKFAALGSEEGANKTGNKAPSAMPLRLGRFLSLLYSLSDKPTNIFYLPLNSRVDGSPTGLLQQRKIVTECACLSAGLDELLHDRTVDGYLAGCRRRTIQGKMPYSICDSISF